MDENKVPWVEARQRRALRIFEGPRKPAMTEGQKTLIKKLEELARVLE